MKNRKLETARDFGAMILNSHKDINSRKKMVFLADYNKKIDLYENALKDKFIVSRKFYFKALQAFEERT